MARNVAIQLALIALMGSEFASASFQNSVSHGCTKDQLHRCIRAAEPLLRNPDFVFPSNEADISTVCRTWNEFVDCVKGYARACMANDRLQQQLQNALDQAMQSADELCTNVAYRSEYLKHAPCIKSMATDETKCRKQLGNLVDQVSALSISNVQTCCAHHAFRECMLAATYRFCRLSLDGTAVQFTKEIFSKSVTYLMKQCEDYVPNSADCPALATTEHDDWETSIGMQESTRPSFVEYTTKRPTFNWNDVQQTTYRPWNPSATSSNSLDAPKQQGLFSHAYNPRASLVPIFLMIILLTKIW